MSLLSPVPSIRARLLSLLLLLGAGANANDAGPPVAVASPERLPIYRQVQVTGTVTSPRVAQLSTATSGLVQAVLVEEGDRVEQGQVLLRLDPELAELERRSARARTSQAATALADAKRRLSEAKSLGPSGGIAETQVLDLASEVEQDNALLLQAEAEAALREALVARHTLAAPFAGIISQREAEVGEWVNPGVGVLTLVATDGLRLDFAVAEDFIAELTEDTPVQFTLNALPGERFTGRVQTLVPVTDPGARTLLLRVVAHDRMQQQDPRMIPGMSARATLQVSAHRDGVVIPRDALLRYADGRVAVWKVNDSDSGTVAHEVPVRTGHAFAGLVEIVEGLGPGDRVVVRGNETLRNGQRVRVLDRPGP
jgi:RND family efflux transporter MFP subunit